MAVNTNDWKIEAKRNYDPSIRCETTYEGHPINVCGSDGYDYHNMYYFRCAQTTEYGKRVNLQLRHEMPCWIWEQHGIETSTIIFVSELRMD